jgi:hypothetical protein
MLRGLATRTSSPHAGRAGRAPGEPESRPRAASSSGPPTAARLVWCCGASTRGDCVPAARPACSRVSTRTSSPHAGRAGRAPGEPESRPRAASSSGPPTAARSVWCCGASTRGDCVPAARPACSRVSTRTSSPHAGRAGRAPASPSRGPEPGARPGHRHQAGRSGAAGPRLAVTPSPRLDQRVLASPRTGRAERSSGPRAAARLVWCCGASSSSVPPTAARSVWCCGASTRGDCVPAARPACSRVTTHRSGREVVGSTRSSPVGLVLRGLDSR